MMPHRDALEAALFDDAAAARGALTVALVVQPGDYDFDDAEPAPCERCGQTQCQCSERLS